MLCVILSNMNHDEQLPMTKAGHAIERWKRGLAVLAIAGIAALGTGLVAGLAMWATEALGFPVLAIYVALSIAAVLLPWMLGDSSLLRTLGGLAKR